MPQDPWVWVVAIVVGAIVVVVGLVLGDKVEVTVNPPSLKFKRKAESRTDRVSVLEEGELRRAKVGDVTGRRVAAGDENAAASASDVAVGKKMKITDSTVGNITGEEVRGSSKPPDKQQPDGR